MNSEEERCVRYSSSEGCDGPFCEKCGDCLICYAEDHCLVSLDGKHEWPGQNPASRISSTIRSMLEDLK